MQQQHSNDVGLNNVPKTTHTHVSKKRSHQVSYNENLKKMFLFLPQQNSDSNKHKIFLERQKLLSLK